MKSGALPRASKSLVRLLPIFALLLGACITDPDARKPGRLTVSGVVLDTLLERTSALVELFASGISEPVATTMADPSVNPGPTFLLEAELPAGTYICSGYTVRAIRADSRSRKYNLGLGYPCSVRGGRSIHKHIEFGLTLRPPVRVVTTSLPDAPLNFAYSRWIVTESASISDRFLWSVTQGSLPTGLTLSSSYGHITGTPTSLGTFHFTAQVTVQATGDYPESDQQALSITVGAVVVLQPSDLCGGHPAIAIATFEDANLEAVIRTLLGGQEALTCEMLGAMTGLGAQNAGVTSLVGIQNLAGLTFLNLQGNSITDISPLSGLTRLASLNLSNNPGLEDIQPLLDNTGFGTGDEVNLKTTNVSCTDVAALQANGVTVLSDCP